MELHFKSMKQVAYIIPFLVSVHLAFAQRPIEVTVQIDQPYPLLVSEYIEDFDIYTLTVWNHTFSSQTISFGMEMIGNNGVRIATEPSYRSESITLDADEITVLAGPFLEDIFSGLSIDQVIREGVGDGIFDVNAVLPEGEYTLCVYAYDVATDIQLSVGCSFTFMAGYGVTPEIIEPQHNSIVPSNDGLGTAWILWDLITTNAMATGYEYNLVIKDVTDFQGWDPDELMADPSIQPHSPVPLENITMEQFFYNDDGASPLEYGRQYAVRVQAIDPMGDLAIPNAGYSATHLFWYGTDTAAIDDGNSEEEEIIDVAEEEEGPTDAQYDCLTNCYFDTSQISQVAHTDPSSLSEINIGHFLIEDLDNINVTANGINGMGEITIPWLSDLVVMVEFTNLMVNQNGRAFSGVVKAQDQSQDLYELSDIHWTLNLAEIAIPDAQLAQIHSYIQNGRIIDAFFGNEEIGVPFGITDTIQGRPINLNVVNIEFRPGSARFDLLHIQQFNLFGEEIWYAAGVGNACLTPGGIANEYIIKQAIDLETNLDNGLTLGFYGSDSNDPTTVRQDATYLEMDCNGLKTMAIRGYVKFPTTTLQLDSSGVVVPGERVTARFSMSLDRTVSIENNIYAQLMDAGQLPEEAGMHFMASVDMDPFQIAGINGWSFIVDSAFLDLSELENPIGMQVPEVYYADNGNGGEIDESWQGFYMKRCALSPPKLFGSDDAAFEVTGLMIDPQVTFNFGGAAIINGNLQGWEFTMDSLGMTVVQNSLQSGYLKGEIGAPVLKDRLDYIGLIDQNDEYIESTLEYSFSVIAMDTVGIEMCSATGELFQNSHFSMNYDPVDTTQTYIAAYLAGYLTIDDEKLPQAVRESSLATFKMPEAIFELGYHSKQGFTHAEFGWLSDAEESGLASETLAQAAASDGNAGANGGAPTVNEDQGNVSGFKINLEDIELDINAFPAVDFIVTPSVTLMGDGEGFGGSVGIRIHSQLNPEANGIKKIRLAAPYVSLDAIHIEATMAGVELEGNVEFYNDRDADGTGNKGVRGDLSVVVPGIDVGVMLAGEFGTSIADPNAPLGTADYFNYWYVNGKVFLGTTGITVPPGFITIHGLGGMVGVNMTMPGATNNNEPMDIGLAASDLRDLPESSPQDAQSGSANPMVLPLVPNFGSRRLGFTLIFAVVNQEIVNMDVGLAATWQQGQGITEVTFTGDCYVMTPIMERGDPKLRVFSQLSYLRPAAGQSSIEGDMQVFVNFGLVRGAYPNNQFVDADFHYQNYDDGTHPAGYWNLTFGTYDQPGRMDIDLGDGIDIEATGYFITGHEVPTTLPPIPDEVEDLLSGGSDDDQGSFSGTEATGGGDRDQYAQNNYKTGSGLAFGSALRASADIDIDILYANFSAIMGFDINITKDPGRVCINSGVSPGVNGWYGTGQAYAGLEGNVGVRFRMFGKDHDIHILSLAAALALEAGAPDPIWFEGRGMVYYSVLGGLVEGDVRFQVTFGERCEIGYGDPLANLALIDKLYPGPDPDGRPRTRVYPDIVPVATFALPMDEWLPVPVQAANGNISTIEFKPYVDENYSKVNGANVDRRPIAWNAMRTKATFGINSPLDENSQYDFNLRIKAKKKESNGAIVDYKDEDGRDWKFDTAVLMRTTELPYPMTSSMVLYTVPHQNQRYYLQDENQYHQGRIQFKMNYYDEYFPEQDDDNRDCEYYIRMTALDQSDTITIKLTVNPNVRHITFPIPELENGVIYAAQLIQKKEYSGWQDMLSDGALNLNHGGLVLSSSSYNRGIADQDVYTNTRVHQYSTDINPAESVRPGEKLIYSWFFKTSDFNTLSDKLSAYEATATADWNGPALVGLNGPEGFDRFDIKGRKYNDQGNERKIAPRVIVTDPFESAYHTEKAMPLVNEMIRRYQNRMNNNPVIINQGSIQRRYNNIGQMRLPELDLPWNTSQGISIIFNEDRVTEFDRPLREQEIDATWLNSLGIGSAGDLFLTSDIWSDGYIDITTGHYVANNELEVDFNTNILVFRDARDLKNWSSSMLTSYYWIQYGGVYPLMPYFENNFPWYLDQHDRLISEYQSLKRFGAPLPSTPTYTATAVATQSTPTTATAVATQSTQTISSLLQGNGTFTVSGNFSFGNALQSVSSFSSPTPSTTIAPVDVQQLTYQVKLKLQANRRFTSWNDLSGTSRILEFNANPISF